MEEPDIRVIDRDHHRDGVDDPLQELLLVLQRLPGLLLPGNIHRDADGPDDASRLIPLDFTPGLQPDNSSRVGADDPVLGVVRAAVLSFGAQAVDIVGVDQRQPLLGPGEGRPAVDPFKVAADPEPVGGRVPVPGDHPRGAEGQFEPLLLEAQFLFHPFPAGDLGANASKQVFSDGKVGGDVVAVAPETVLIPLPDA